MIDNKPLVTIAICIFNDRYLKDLLSSLESQTYKKIEYIFSIDNYSNRELISQVNEFKNKNVKAQIFINKPALGSRKNYEFCLTKANGDFFIRIDDDDVPYDQYYIEKLVNVICNGYDFIIPRVDIIDENNNLKKENITHSYENCVSAEQFALAYFNESAMIFFSLWKTNKLRLLKNHRYNSHYIEGYTNLYAAINFKGAYCYDARLLYRIHNENLSSSDKAENYIKDYTIYFYEAFKVVLSSRNKISNHKQIILRLITSYFTHMSVLCILFIKSKLKTKI